MFSINKIVKYNRGECELNITSNDKYRVKLPKNYKLVNHYSSNILKNTLLGSDIGINSEGFVTITVISTLIAVASFIMMILSFRI